MQKISVVIVCKNEEEHIGNCIESLRDLTDDVVVLDNGSTDRTREIIAGKRVKLIVDEWRGYGKTKNRAALHTKYDWILSLDADEEIDDDLRGNLKELAPDENAVYKFRFKNFLGKKHLRYGEWGNDAHIRLFNKHKVSWDEEAVHEKLLLPAGTIVKKITGAILHYTVKDLTDYSAKMLRYGLLNAEKYAAAGKRSSALKVFLAPRLAFARYYFFKLGFLDGRAGLTCAYMTSYYSFIKYARLLELQNPEQGTRNSE
jgi:glycosyltransferase involved in cell wall biosynthesis